jgi:hypothetical protein
VNDVPESGSVSERAHSLPAGEPPEAPTRARTVRVRTVVLGLLLLLLSVGAVLGEVISIRVDMTVMAIVLLAVVGAGLFAGGLVSAVRQSRAGHEV